MAGLFLYKEGIGLTEKEEREQLPEAGYEPVPDHRRRRRLMAALAAAFLLGSFFTIGAGGVFLKLRENSRPISQQKLSEIQELIEENYLFDVDEEAAANAAAAGYAGTLDQYSRYRNSEEYADFQAHNDGSLCGIGVTVAQYAEDSLYVLFLSDDSPADGIILPGDEIVAVEGERVADLGYTDTVSKIRGQEGTSVSLTIRRDGEETEVSVMRADIVNDGIHALTIGNIGYVRVSAFNNATPEAFEKAVDSLQADDGVTGLIFDLRGNGIPKHDLSQKLFGIFPHRVLQPFHPLLRGFDETFYVPHSRHTCNWKDEILACGKLEILTESPMAGVHIAASFDGRQFFVTGHSEYDRGTLAAEYFRDLDKGLPIQVPYNYFDGDNPENEPKFIWRAHANLLFVNWLNYFVYQQTPYDLRTMIQGS